MVLKYMNSGALLHTPSKREMDPQEQLQREG